MNLILEKLVTYLIVFGVGGTLCVIAQLFIIYTKLTPSRILLGFLFTGMILEAVGAYEYIRDFARSGVTIPILGFGATLAKGAIDGVNTTGFLGMFSGGLTAAAVGVGAAVALSYIAAFIFSARSK